MNAIDEYWFDVHGENFPKGYTPSVVTMVWGGKGANGTWFTAKPEARPRHQLAADPRRLALPRPLPGLRREELRGAGGGERRHELGRRGPTSSGCTGRWPTRPDAIRQFEAARRQVPVEGGNSRANTYHWIYSLNELGRVDADVTADYPLYAVFQKGKTRTYCVYNMADEARTVTFSDGFRLKAEGKGFAHAMAGE